MSFKIISDLLVDLKIGTNWQQPTNQENQTTQIHWYKEENGDIKCFNNADATNAKTFLDGVTSTQRNQNTHYNHPTHCFRNNRIVDCTEDANDWVSSNQAYIRADIINGSRLFINPPFCPQFNLKFNIIGYII